MEYSLSSYLPRAGSVEIRSAIGLIFRVTFDSGTPVSRTVNIEVNGKGFPVILPG